MNWCKLKKKVGREKKKLIRCFMIYNRFITQWCWSLSDMWVEIILYLQSDIWNASMPCRYFGSSESTLIGSLTSQTCKLNTWITEQSESFKWSFKFLYLFTVIIISYFGLLMIMRDICVSHNAKISWGYVCKWWVKTALNQCVDIKRL